MAESVVMEDVNIIFRNFAGEERKYNREGDRNFAILLPDDVAEAMTIDGWNIKWLEPREDAEEGETRQAYLPVKLSYKGKPPTVAIITARGRTNLKEDTVEMLDWADIINVDVVINPYEYDVNGKTGISAYVKSLFVKIEEDVLEAKYADLDVQ